MRILISGGVGGTNVGDSFYFAAHQLGWDVEIVDTGLSMGNSIWMRRLQWRLMNKRPSRLSHYNRVLQQRLREFQPNIFLTTGVAPVTSDTLRVAQRLQVKTANFSTDDPWNPNHYTRRFERSIGDYHHVFTPRLANVTQFKYARAKEVSYLPFGYDPRHVTVDATEMSRTPSCDLLFVGGGDQDRISLLRPLVKAGIRLTIIGSYWEGDRDLSGVCLGQLPPTHVAAYTAKAKVALIMVRKSNRDGHTMRSFESAATGCCILAEDTPDHQRIFGESANYFQCSDDIVRTTHELLLDEIVRQRLADNAKKRITNNANTYLDRLIVIYDRLKPEIKPN